MGSSVGRLGTDLGEYVIHFLIAEGRVLCRGGHEGDGSEGLAVELDKTDETVEEDFGRAIPCLR